MRTRWANDRFSLPENLEGSAFLKTAESFTGPLLETSRSEFVHGDLQAKNILVARDHLVSIDPFACIGDPLFDAALWNVMLSGPQPIDLVLEQFSGGIYSPRLLAWTWVLAAIELRPYLPEHAKRLRSFLLTYQEQATLYVESLA